MTLETAANLIRAITNDMIFAQAGEVLTDNSNILFPLLNDALEWFENEVNNHGVNTFTKESVLTPVTAIGVLDPGIQVNISDTGYFDGLVNHALPQLPTDLLAPLFLWERQTGSKEDWQEMRPRPDGLPSVNQNQRLGIWEWRADALYMPGATQSNDLRLRYEGTHASFATTNDAVLFRGGIGPISWKVVSVYLASKNPEASTLAGAEAKQRVSQIATRNARMKQRESITRIGYGNQRRSSNFTPPHN